MPHLGGAALSNLGFWRVVPGSFKTSSVNHVLYGSFSNTDYI